jgi:hypothetical protein
MKQIGLRKLAIATSTVAVATLLSAGWSEQRGFSLSVDTAQARRLYVSPHYRYNPFNPTITGLSWDAVRAYYAGGPWCGAGGPTGYGAAAGALWAGTWGCYSGWADYAQRNGIGCEPGTLVKGGDGIMYVCQ